MYYYFVCIDSEQKSKDSYEDDYQYDGEREDSDVESSEPPSTRYENIVLKPFTIINPRLVVQKVPR